FASRALCARATSRVRRGTACRARQTYLATCPSSASCKQARCLNYAVIPSGVSRILLLARCMRARNAVEESLFDVTPNYLRDSTLQRKDLPRILGLRPIQGSPRPVECGSLPALLALTQEGSVEGLRLSAVRARPGVLLARAKITIPTPRQPGVFFTPTVDDFSLHQ